MYKKMPISNRRIDTESLPTFGATLLLSSTDSGITRPSSLTQSQQYSPIGIRISQWEIRTQNSTIGDEESMQKLTKLLEDVASASEVNSAETTVKRRLCPPEITFLGATISLKYHKAEIRFNATDALIEWAEAHRYLDYSFNNNSSTKEYRGVKILKTKDAKIWTTKSSDKNRDAMKTCEFYYDWTFATPYSGTIRSPTQSTRINDESKWKPELQSSIPFSMLQDTSQPILFYDDITLFEDDLHDNGDVSLNVKVRVMPSCWYVLQRLFVRVDHVCIKCREVRIFCYLGKQNKNIGIDVNTAYRDIMWKEATWDDLTKLGLPTDPSRWRFVGDNAGIMSQMIAKLPTVELPNELPRYSSMSFN